MNRGFFIALCGMAILMGFAGGCRKPVSESRDPILHRALTEHEKRTRKELHNKSEDLQKQLSAQNLNRTQESDPGGGTLTVGAETLNLTELSLMLGPLTTPGDAGGGQAPSALLTPASNPALHISPLAIESATSAQQVAGQSFAISSSSNMVAEITGTKGGKWALDKATVSFTHADKNMVFLSLEGQAVDLSGEKPDKVKVAGELRARVKQETDSSAPPNP